MVKQIIKVDGMMCGMCEAHVSDAVRNAFPVKKVTASHTKGQVVVMTEKEIPEDELKKAIDPTGYTVLSAVSEPYEKKNIFGWRKHD